MPHWSLDSMLQLQFHAAPCDGVTTVTASQKVEVQMCLLWQNGNWENKWYSSPPAAGRWIFKSSEDWTRLTGVDTSRLYLQLNVCISERHINESYLNIFTSGPSADRGAIVTARKGKKDKERRGGRRVKRWMGDMGQSNAPTPNLISIILTVPVHWMTIIYLQRV